MDILSSPIQSASGFHYVTHVSQRIQMGENRIILLVGRMCTFWRPMDLRYSQLTRYTCYHSSRVLAYHPSETTHFYPSPDSHQSSPSKCIRRPNNFPTSFHSATQHCSRISHKPAHPLPIPTNTRFSPRQSPRAYLMHHPPPRSPSSHTLYLLRIHILCTPDNDSKMRPPHFIQVEMRIKVSVSISRKPLGG